MAPKYKIKVKMTRGKEIIFEAVVNKNYKTRATATLAAAKMFAKLASSGIQYEVFSVLDPFEEK